MQRKVGNRKFSNQKTEKIPRYRMVKVSSVIILCLLFASVITAIRPALGDSQVYVTVNPGMQIDSNDLSLGFMLDWEWESWQESSQQRQLAKDANFKLVRLFSNRIEPCTRWYEGSKSGNFNWGKVDELIQQILEMGGEPIIVLGKFSAPGRPLEVPYGMAIDSITNLPYQDSYAAYCAEWVKHFKASGLSVRYYEIVNEAFFYFGWDKSETTLIGNFVKLFNSASREMRKIDGKILVGNNAFLQKKFLDYFVKYGEDMDFIAFNKYGMGEEGGSDSEALNEAKLQRYTETQNWYSIEQGRQIWYANRGEILPIIQTESNLSYAWEQGADTRNQQMIGAVYTAIVLRESILRGVNYHIYYVFASNPNYQSSGYGFGMIDSSNNQPWYPYYVHKMIGTTLAVGDKIVETTSSSSEISAITWIHDSKLYILLICEVDQWITVNLNGVQGQLNVSWIDNTVYWKTANIQNSIVDANQPLTMKGYTVALIEAQSAETPPTSSPSEFEDGFEGGDFSKWTGTETSYGESITVASYNSYSGTYHSRYASNGGSGIEYAYCFKDVNEEEIYARGYFRIANGLPLVDNNDRFYLMFFKANDQHVAGIGIRKHNGIEQWIAFGRDGTGWVWPTYKTSPAIEEDKWYYIELFWQKESYQGNVEVYIDGEKVFDITGLNTAQYGNVDRVEFGMTHSSGLQNNLIIYGDSYTIS